MDQKVTLLICCWCGLCSGFPKDASLQPIKNKTAHEAAKGTVKVMQTGAGDDSILAVGLYDEKPVHFMDAQNKDVKWVQCTKQRYSDVTKVVASVVFLRLSNANHYNWTMGSCDRADQLRMVYRPDHWMRQRKWWWSIFIWALGIAVTNAYELWRNIWERENPPALRPGRATPVRPKPKYTHRTFIEAVIHGLYAESDLLKSNLKAAQAKKKKNKPSARTSTSSSSSSSGSSRKRAKRLTDAFYESCPRDIAKHGAHTFIPTEDDKRCQLCMKELDIKARADMHCDQCDLHLCVGHWNPWHKQGDPSKWIESGNL